MKCNAIIELRGPVVSDWMLVHLSFPRGQAESPNMGPIFASNTYEERVSWKFELEHDEPSWKAVALAMKRFVAEVPDAWILLAKHRGPFSIRIDTQIR